MTHGPRVIRRIPTTAEQATAEWRAADHWSRELLREILRLDYDGTQIGADGLVYVDAVGRNRLTLVLAADIAADALTIRRVTQGRTTRTARDAAIWLRGQAPRCGCGSSPG